MISPMFNIIHLRSFLSRKEEKIEILFNLTDLPDDLIGHIIGRIRVTKLKLLRNDTPTVTLSNSVQYELCFVLLLLLLLSWLWLLLLWLLLLLLCALINIENIFKLCRFYVSAVLFTQQLPIRLSYT